MTLLLTLFAALAVTVIWYVNPNARRLHIGTLCLMYWGASLMWFVDAVVEYLEMMDEYFHPSYADMLNDSFLGLSVIALGLVIWMITVFIRDPDGVIHAALKSNK